MSDEKKGAVLTGEELDEIARLEKEATPGPWHGGHNPDGYDPIDYFRAAYDYGPPGRVHLTCIPAPGKDVNDEALFTAITGNGPTSEANAALIASLRNAAPALLESARLARLASELFREHGDSLVLACERYPSTRAALAETIAAFRKGAE